ncbi:hypothetical protein KHP62_06775 [Rhodobacteraceae bacterium NNCM2]|nr:hypothetical protein [Coraliihabitans acroporae]
MADLARLIDLDRFPLDRLETPEGEALIARCEADLAREDLFNPDGLMRREALVAVVSDYE